MVFDEVKDKIYPWIKKSLNDNDTHSNNAVLIDIPEKSLLADLFIIFVADMGEKFEVLQNEHLPNGMTIDELFELSVNNLSNNIEFKLSSTNFGGYGILAGGDHEAGCLCLDYLWEQCANKIGENLIISVPSKDMVLMVGQSQTEELEKMKAISFDIIKSGDKILSEQLLFYDKQEKRLMIYE